MVQLLVRDVVGRPALLIQRLSIPTDSERRNQGLEPPGGFRIRLGTQIGHNGHVGKLDAKFPQQQAHVAFILFVCQPVFVGGRGEDVKFGAAQEGVVCGEDVRNE